MQKNSFYKKSLCVLRGSRRGFKVFILLILFLILFLIGCNPQEKTSESSRTMIAVIPKGTTQFFWKMVESGARKAAEELDVEIVWKGPMKENDRALQIALVEQFVTEGVSGIVLAPLDQTALVRPVRSAAAQKIPVVIFDSDLEAEVGKDYISFVATDNRKGGEIAGNHMVNLLNGKGKVVVLRYQVGSASTTLREEGFLSVVREAKGIEILADNQYAGATSGETIQKSEEMLDVLREADGIFCPNEATTYGMLVTLRKHQLAGEKRFIGFDSSEELLRAVESDEIQGLVLQNPKKMGYLGVQTLVKQIRGELIDERVDTGVFLVTRDNLNSPEVLELVKVD